MNLDADSDNLPSPLTQKLFEPRLQLAQLGGHRCVGAEQGPALFIHRPRLHVGGECGRQGRFDGGESGVRIRQPLPQVGQWRAAHERVGHWKRVGHERLGLLGG